MSHRFHKSSRWNSRNLGPIYRPKPVLARGILSAGHKYRPAYDFDYVALDLLQVYPEENGVYKCTARNAYGQAETSATVKVVGKC